MADVAVPTIRDDSKYRVAFELMQLIGRAEGAKVGYDNGASREWILRTYVECLNATGHNANKLATPGEVAAWLRK